jgi:hydrogen peroxide-dependent heme synthase
MTEQQSNNPNAQRIKELNETIRYTMWSVFRASDPFPGIRQDLVQDTEHFFEKQCGDLGVVVRGTYDLTGMRADADVMVWWHAETVEALQQAYSGLRRTAFGRHLAPVWSNVALHRPAEFNRSHLPAFLAEEEPRAYVCVYPFVRSYEWYLLPDDERRDLLREHGQMARDYPDVRANTVASFGLGDYEWILAFEADELHRIVDLMRELRASRARLHVREEIPFYTGRRRPIGELINDLP